MINESNIKIMLDKDKTHIFIAIAPPLFLMSIDIMVNRDAIPIYARNSSPHSLNRSKTKLSGISPNPQIIVFPIV